MLAAILTLTAPPAAAGGIHWEYEELKLVNEEIIEQLEEVELEYDDSRYDWIKQYAAQSDPTRPDVQLWAVIEGPDGAVEDVVVTDASASLEIKPGQTLVLFASANEDSGGALANVILEGETSRTCVDSTNTFGQHQQALWYADSPDPDPYDAVYYDWRLVALSIPVSALGCPAGYSLTGWRATFHARADNLAGLSKQTATVIVESL